MGLDNPMTLILVFAIVALPMYFLPSIIGRNKNNFNSILLLNIFLGWTFIGWIIALVWAVSTDKQPFIVYNTPNVAPAKTDEIIKFKQLLDGGAITQDEYDKEKARILNS
jgi:hypothetical protein